LLLRYGCSSRFPNKAMRPRRPGEVKHRAVRDIKLGYVIRVEFAAAFSKHPSDGASFSSRSNSAMVRDN
jgi:hypothetical protein